jgi:hypothetical protein
VPGEATQFYVFFVLTLVVAAIHLIRNTGPRTIGRVAEVLLLWFLVIFVWGLAECSASSGTPSSQPQRHAGIMPNQQSPQVNGRGPTSGTPQASDQEIDSIVYRMGAFVQDPTTLVAFPRIVHVWGTA